MSNKSGVLAGVLAGDHVVVTRKVTAPDGSLRTVRKIHVVTKVFKHVIQSGNMTGISIKTGQGGYEFADAHVRPAIPGDEEEINSENAEFLRMDLEIGKRKKEKEAEYLRRYDLREKIRGLLRSSVTEDVLQRVIDVLELRL
jgi:hypothetical protein